MMKTTQSRNEEVLNTLSDIRKTTEAAEGFRDRTCQQTKLPGKAPSARHTDTIQSYPETYVTSQHMCLPETGKSHCTQTENWIMDGSKIHRYKLMTLVSGARQEKESSDEKYQHRSLNSSR